LSPPTGTGGWNSAAGLHRGGGGGTSGAASGGFASEPPHAPAAANTSANDDPDLTRMMFAQALRRCCVDMPSAAAVLRDA
jgi:hypothetical protein